MTRSYLYTYFDFIKLKQLIRFIKNCIDSDDDRRCRSKRPRFYRINLFFSSLRSDDTEKERKRHDLALEQLTKARDEWSKERVKYLDYMNGRLRKEANAKQTFTDINEAMNEYYVVTGGRFALPPNLRKEP